MDMCAAEASEHPGHLPRYLGAGQGRRPWWHRDGDVAGDGGDDEEGYDVFGWQLTPYKGTTFQGWGSPTHHRHSRKCHRVWNRELLSIIIRQRLS